MKKTDNIDCVGLQREIRNQMVKEANFNLRKLVEMINENTKDDEILQKYNNRREKDKQLKAV